jgi:hypothetical protein
LLPWSGRRIDFYSVDCSHGFEVPNTGVDAAKVMAKKKRKLDKVQLVKEMSRERIGTVQTEKVLPNKRREKIAEAREQEAWEDRNG